LNKELQFLGIVVIAATLIFFVAPLVSNEPDGLETTVNELDSPAVEPVPFVALGDYSVPSNVFIGGLIVLMLVGALLYGMASKN